MKRVITAFAIIAAILIYSAIAISTIHFQNKEILDITSQIKKYSDSGEIETASEYAVVLNRKWKSYMRKMSFTVSDDKLCEIDASVARIEPYLLAGNEELDAELQNIDRRVSQLYSSELPYWYNVL